MTPELPNIELVRLASVERPRYQRTLDEKRAIEIAKDFDFRAVGVPLVSNRDGALWIVDGQHRVTMLLQRGYEEWPCEVLNDLKYEDEAVLFVRRNNMKVPPVLVTFNARFDGSAEPAVSAARVAARWA